jgi:hypothetical protein
MKSDRDAATSLSVRIADYFRSHSMARCVSMIPGWDHGVASLTPINLRMEISAFGLVESLWISGHTHI